MKIIRFGVFIALAGTLVSCASGTKVIPLTPAWVEEGSGVFSAEGTIGIQGVGVSAGIEDSDLAAKVADRLAQRAIGPYLNDLETELRREYLRPNAQNPASLSEQEVKAVLSRFTRAAEKYVRMVDHWRNPDTTSFFALARLDLEGMLAGVNQLEGLDGEMQRFLREMTGPVLERMLASRNR